MKKQRILSLLLALAMTFSLLPATALAADVKDFTDVSKDDWYYEYVDHVVDEEYFAGTSETTFSPNMSMDRAMFAVVLAAVEGVEVDNNVAPFADVPAGTWYSGAVAWAAENGIVAGGDNNMFFPTTPITREQMAVIMNAYINWYSDEKGADHEVNTKVESFGDADKISSWAAKAVDVCRDYGLVAGAPDGNFYPQNSATRAEVATVIYNLAWVRYGGGGGNPGTDYIYLAVKGALEEVKEDIANKGYNTDEDSSSVSGSYKGSSVTITGIEVVKPTNKKADRAQNVTVTVDASADTIQDIADFAVNTAVSTIAALSAGEDANGIISGSVADMSNYVSNIVSDIVDEINRVFDLTIELNEASIRENIDTAYNKGVVYGKSLWANHFVKENGYVTGDITLTVGDTEVKVIVDAEAKNAYLDGDDNIATVKKMAVAIAKELYADLLDETSPVPVTAIDPDVVIGVKFSDGAYASDTKKYSYNYPLTIKLDLEGTAADNIRYYFDGEHNVQMVITDKVKETYLDAAEQIVAEATMLAMEKAAESAAASVEGTTAANVLKGLFADPEIDYYSVGVQNALEAVLADPQYAEYAEIFDTLPTALQDYAKALVCDAILGEDAAECVTPEMTAAAEAAAAEMEISELKKLADMADVNTVQYEQYIEKIEKLTDFSAVKQMKLRNLATALEMAADKGIEISLADSIVGMIEMLPANAYITVDGTVISEDVLVAIRDAEDNTAALDAIADMINLLGDLCLADFMEGVQVYVNYNDKYDTTVNVYVVEV